MMIEEHEHDEKCLARVHDMQHACDMWLKELLWILQRHVTGCGTKDMEIENLRTRLAELEGVDDDLEQIKMTDSQHLQLAADEIEKFKIRFAALDQDAKESRLKMSLAIQASASKDNEIQELETELKQTRQQLTDSNTKVEVLQKQFEVETDVLRNANVTLSLELACIQELRDANEILNEAHVKTTKDLEQARAEIVTFQKDLEQTTKEHDELLKQLAEQEALARNLERKTQEGDNLSAALADMTVERDGLMQDIEVMTAERDTLMGEIEERSTELLKVTEDLEKLTRVTKERDTIQEELGRLKIKCENLQRGLMTRQLHATNGKKTSSKWKQIVTL